jgi:tRNA dimethylallyltransferase
VYLGLDIGTEKISQEEIRQLAERGVPHHLIDIRDVNETYSAGDFVTDATRLIKEISARGKLPVLVGGTHFYFDALLNGLSVDINANPKLREELEKLSTEELYARVRIADARRAAELDPQNRRRLIRALEIIDAKGKVPARIVSAPAYDIEWIVIDPPKEELRARIDARLKQALERGLVDEVRRVREMVGDLSRRSEAKADERLNELGLEYKIVGEFLRCERDEESLFPTLSSKLWQYARRQKAWLRKLSLAKQSRQDKN